MHGNVSTVLTPSGNKSRDRQVAQSGDSTVPADKAMLEGAKQPRAPAGDLLADQPGRGPSSLVANEASALMAFQAHSLDDLDRANLMDRVDSKFVVPRTSLCPLLVFLREHYTALEINGERVSHYHNCYFDTDDYTHYLAHHNRLSNRYKLRQRTYTDTGESFIEVKFRNNRRRTVKTRVPVEAGSAPLSDAANQFIAHSGISQFGHLRRVQIGNYERISLANEHAAERITIDLDMVFDDMHTGRSHEVGDWVVVEVKQAELNRNAPFFLWARSQGLRRCSFSKYCMGIYYAGPETLKRNNFHKVNRQLTLLERRQARIMQRDRSHTSATSILSDPQS